MRIVMLSCNTGEGHNSTAKAIRDVLESRGVGCEIVDVLALLSPNFSKYVCNWHARLYKYAPKLWDASYRAFEAKEMGADERAILVDLLSFSTKKLRAMLEKGNYDAIVCVHVFSSMMMTRLRRVWDMGVPCYFVATDYTCSPYVDCCEMDGYFIPAEKLRGEFTAAGLPADKLIPSGIPVRQTFYERSDRDTAREVLQLPHKGRVVLMMCGSMGCGPMRKIAKELPPKLPEDALLVAFCGRNKKLYDTLSAIEEPRLRVLGYTDKVSQYMDAADLIVTKPGGLSATEAANKQLPMVFIDAVGGCESRNFAFFLNRGYALGSKDPEKVVQQAADLADDPEQMIRMAQALQKGFAKNSAVCIADILMEAATRYRGNQAPCGIKNGNNGYSLNATEGGCTMEQTKLQTIENLARSFAGESQARTRYTVYADVARREGYEWIGRVFEETAANEAVHAEEFLEMLSALGGCADNIDVCGGYPFQLGSTLENLAAAAAGELHEHDDAYPGFAEMARREGCNDAALLWMQIARVEGVHHNTFRQLHEQMQGGTLTHKDKSISWRCLNCGYTYEGPNACDPCPVCKKGGGWQEGELDRKRLIPKK